MNLLAYVGWKFPQVGRYDERQMKHDLNEKVLERLDELIRLNTEIQAKLVELEERIEVLEP